MSRQGMKRVKRVNTEAKERERKCGARDKEDENEKAAKEKNKIRKRRDGI